MKITRYSTLHLNVDRRFAPRSTRSLARRAAAFAALAGLLAGCGSVDPLAIDYQSTTKSKAPTLDLPPELSSSAQDQRAFAPASGVTSLSAQRQIMSTTSHAEAVLPNVPGMHIQRDGSVRWLVVSNQSFEQLWPEVRKFWEEQGFLLVVDQKDRHVMETDWNETHARIDQDIVRNLLSKAMDNSYVTGVRNKFRTRLEAGPDGSQYIFISQKGMHEVLTGTTKDNSQWENTPNDPGLEAEYLTRLMGKLALAQSRAAAGIAPDTSDAAASAAIAANVAAKSKAAQAVAASEAAARQAALEAAQGPRRSTVVADNQIKLNDGYEAAWATTGLALEHANFTIDGRDKDTGLYSIRYVDPTDLSVATQGFWSQIFHGKKEKIAKPYQINVKALTENSCRVAIVDSAGVVQTSAPAQRILKLLAAQLN
jgi:outer membrane protein assembly factor BamC